MNEPYTVEPMGKKVFAGKWRVLADGACMLDHLSEEVARDMVYALNTARAMRAQTTMTFKHHQCLDCQMMFGSIVEKPKCLYCKSSRVVLSAIPV